MPATPETVFAFDFGKRRIGIAVGQEVTGSASPLAIVRNGDNGPDWRAVQALIEQWQPQRLVVGMPLHADGSTSDLSEDVDQFVGQLVKFGLPVELVDERFSSLEAEKLLKERRKSGAKGRKTRKIVDAVAATLIAERWLKKTH